MKDVLELAKDFGMMQLPGQPQVMHAGTLQLVGALAREVERLRPDATRWRAIRPCLEVVRDAPGDWTRWLALPCVPLRSDTTDPDALTDMLAKLADERKQKP